MINAARTYLLNQPARPLGVDGAAYVDPDFIPRPDQGDLRRLRQLLFGVTPDPLTWNYRAIQYLNILHADSVAEPYVLALDSRYTYRGDSLLNYPFGVTTTLTAGAGQLLVSGDFTGDDQYGINKLGFLVTAAGDLSATVTQTTGGFSQLQLGAGAAAALPGTVLQVQVIQATAAPARWQINLAARPARNLAFILAQLQAEKALVMRAAGAGEPMATFQNLFQYGENAQRQLAGALLIAIYLTKQAQGV